MTEQPTSDRLVERLAYLFLLGGAVHCGTLAVVLGAASDWLPGISVLLAAVALTSLFLVVRFHSGRQLAKWLVGALAGAYLLSSVAGFLGAQAGRETASGSISTLLLVGSYLEIAVGAFLAACARELLRRI